MITLEETRERAATRGALSGTVFSSALAILRRKGWAKGAWHTSDGSVCLMGAIEDAIVKVLGLSDVKDPEELRDATNIVEYYLRDTYPDQFTVHIKGTAHPAYPSGWNDAPARTMDQVVAILEHLAATEASTPFDHLLAHKPNHYLP